MGNKNLLKNSINILKQKKIRPSLIRLKILSYLLSTKEHPSIENIYEKLLSEIPTLSKTSVYNTLKLFVKKGITLEINIPEHESHFDGDISFHGHFLCMNCRKIEDIDILCKGDCINKIKNKNREIISHQILFYGYCDACRKLINSKDNQI